MHFMLITLKATHVLNTPRPEVDENETLEKTRKRNKWDKDDYICRGHILNGMFYSLYETHSDAKSVKEL